MIRVVLLGYGNVGQRLHQAMQASTAVEVIQVYTRTQIKGCSISQTQQLSTLKPADIYIIAVPDNAIATLSEALPFKNSLVVHTSGGVPMQELSNQNRKGVFYPLQTFSKNKTISFLDIPICIEAENNSDLQQLRILGEALSEKVVEITSEKRSALHLAAVFVNNFANHLYTIASEISVEKNIDFDLLKPLIAETAKKIDTLTPQDAQTGPAKRNDTNTIKKHLALLQDENHRAIYSMFTDAIKQYHNKDA